MLGAQASSARHDRRASHRSRGHGHRVPRAPRRAGGAAIRPPPCPAAAPRDPSSQPSKRAKRQRGNDKQYCVASTQALLRLERNGEPKGDSGELELKGADSGPKIAVIADELVSCLRFDCALGQAAIMANLHPTHRDPRTRWMRAWIIWRFQALKALTARNFRMVMAAEAKRDPRRKSWVEAATTRYLVLVLPLRRHLRARHWRDDDLRDPARIEATMDGHDWSGEYWITDLWRKSRVRRNWRMVERVVSRPEEKPDAAAAIRHCNFGAVLKTRFRPSDLPTRARPNYRPPPYPLSSTPL